MDCRYRIINNQPFIDYPSINPEICNDIDPEVLVGSECADLY